MTSATSRKILPGNCLSIMPEITEASFDMMLTDPPYGTTNLSFDRVKIDWTAWWEQVHRVCKPQAVLVCFAAQPFTTDLINANRKHFRYDLIWHKTNAVGFLSANVRPLRSHEHILVFCRRFGRYQAKKMESVYNPQFTAGLPYTHRSRSRPAAHYAAIQDVGSYRNEGRRYPTSVLTYSRDARSHHPTAKPVELLRWLIRTYSHAGQCVLDPFAGSGSTGVAATLEGREFVGIELDAEYYATAVKRIEEAEGRIRHVERPVLPESDSR